MLTRSSFAWLRWAWLLVLLGCGGGSAPLPAASDGGDPAKVWYSCTRSAECPGHLPTCDPSAGVCTGCIDDSCPSGKVCDRTTHLCLSAAPFAKCLRNADCPRAGFDGTRQVVCESSLGACVECAVDQDCVAPARCAASGVAPSFTCTGDQR